jgi:hypothetical protein
VVFRVLFDHLCNQLFQRLQRFTVQPFLPAGLEEKAELFAVLSEHRLRWSWDTEAAWCHKGHHG